MALHTKYLKQTKMTKAKRRPVKPDTGNGQAEKEFKLDLPAKLSDPSGILVTVALFEQLRVNGYTHITITIGKDSRRHVINDKSIADLKQFARVVENDPIVEMLLSVIGGEG